MEELGVVAEKPGLLMSWGVVTEELNELSHYSLG